MLTRDKIDELLMGKCRCQVALRTNDKDRIVVPLSLTAESVNGVPLRGADKNFNVEGLKGRMKVFCEGLIRK